MPMSPHVQYIGESWEDADMQGYKGPGWYFWDETECYCYGPYVAEIIAVKALGKYAEWLDSPEGRGLVPVAAAVSFLPGR